MRRLAGDAPRRGVQGPTDYRGWKATRGPTSDEKVFPLSGIAYVGFESANWSAGTWKGYPYVLNTKKEGLVWNTAKDDLGKLNRTYPGRIQRQLRNLVRLLEPFLTSPKTAGR
jgi:hypothetical protein